MKTSLFGTACACLFAQSLSAGVPCAPGPVWMVVRHDVADYATWRRVFDSGLSTRRSAGELSFRIVTAPGERAVVGIFEWDSAQRAHAFAHDPFVSNAMRAGTVVSGPVASLHETEPRGTNAMGDGGDGPPSCLPPS